MNCHNTKIWEQALHLLLLHTQSLTGLSKVCGAKRQWHIRTRVLDPFQPSTVCNLCEGRAISRHWTQHAFYGELAWIRHVSRNTVSPLEDGALQLSHVVPEKWHSGRYHEVQEDTQGPDVWIEANVAFYPKQFRSSIRWWATKIGEELIGAALCAEAKISNLDAVAGGVKNIFCLKVSVDDVLVVLKDQKISNVQ